MRTSLRVEPMSSGPMPGSPATLAFARLPVRLRQFLTFALVGVAGTAAHYLVLAILVEIVAAPVLLATTAGFVVGAVINYALNRRFTFVSTSPHHVALPKFLTVAATGALLNAAVVALFVEVALWHYLLAQLLATVTVLGWNFVANLAWTFRT